jgi:hypothetical protein
MLLSCVACCLHLVDVFVFDSRFVDVLYSHDFDLIGVDFGSCESTD